MVQPVSRQEGAEPVLAVVGARGSSWGDRLKSLATQAKLHLSWVTTTAEIQRLGGSGAAAVVLPLTSDAPMWAALRSDPALSSTPLLGLSPEASELAFAETFARGGDDLLGLEGGDDVLAKLRALQPPPPPETQLRTALIVSADPVWRGGAARRLRGAGVQVFFAESEAEARASLALRAPTVVVLDGAGKTEASVAMIRGLLTPKTPWVLSVDPGDQGKAREALGSASNVAVHDAFGLADALLFVVNELTAGSVQERRRAPRVLFGTRVWARLAGAEREMLGYSYTVSEGGLFLRSLAPFELGAKVWVELTPPRVGRRVRLAATAVWARGFGPLGKALSPPGTGLRIDGGLPGEWELYKEGCQALLEGGGGAS